MKRIVSGIKPSGDMTIGNYLGAIKRFSVDQNSKENFFFIANLHAITVPQDPIKLQRKTLDIVAWLLADGIDPSKSIIFIQSMIPAHSEIAWILNNSVTMGELGKMTQFKDKSQKSGREAQLVGLFIYPVLMSGDVLLYDADEIPVGDDQKQHIELCRNIAQRFNNQYGQTFKLPNAVVSKMNARIMSLDDPTVKMSKSNDSENSYVALEDTSDKIMKKFKRAVTDSENLIKYDPKNKPAISNLLEIYAGFSDKNIEETEEHFKEAGYGKLKTELGELVADKLSKLQTRFYQIRNDESYLNEVIKNGNHKALIIADAKIRDVKNKIGLL